MAGGLNWYSCWRRILSRLALSRRPARPDRQCVEWRRNRGGARRCGRHWKAVGPWRRAVVCGWGAQCVCGGRDVEERVTGREARICARLYRIAIGVAVEVATVWSAGSGAQKAEGSALGDSDLCGLKTRGRFVR